MKLNLWKAIICQYFLTCSVSFFFKENEFCLNVIAHIISLYIKCFRAFMSFPCLDTGTYIIRWRYSVTQLDLTFQMLPKSKISIRLSLFKPQFAECALLMWVRKIPGWNTIYIFCYCNRERRHRPRQHECDQWTVTADLGTVLATQVHNLARTSRDSLIWQGRNRMESKLVRLK